MSRSCTVCGHTDRKAIDRAILAGDSNRTVANRFAIGMSSITRHALNHVRPAAKAKAKAATTKALVREAAAAEQHADVVEAALEQSRSTLDLVIRLRDRAIGYLDKAEQPQPVFAKDGSVVGEEVDWRAVAALLREARGCLTAQAELLGELAPKRVELSGPGGVPLNAPPEVQAAWSAASEGDDRALSVTARWLVTASTDPVRQLAVLRRLVADAEAELRPELPAHNDEGNLQG